jgi:ATP-binding cassette subfamily F protein 3
MRVGYFAQHQAEELDLTAAPVLELSRRRPNDSERELRSHLGAFGFSQERADTRIANLSGGEKARLLFALMASAKPHLLLLDEPTNHLDMDSREALAHAINAFEGAVIIISHDPHIIELTADRFWLVENGGVAAFDGDLEDYRNRLLARRAPERPAAAKPKSAAPQPAPAKPARPSKKRLDQAEALVNKMHQRCEALRQALADPTLYSGPPAKLRTAQTDLQTAEKDLAAAEETWMALQEAWDSIAAE